MPRNPSGEYSLPYNWNDDKADGIKILASKMQTQEQDIADALTGSLPVNGSAPMQADLDMNNNNIVDVSDGVSLQDAMTVKQGQSGSLQYFGVSSTIPAGTNGEDYEIATAPIITVYPAFLRFSFVCHFTCVDSPNMRLNTLATKNFFKEDGAGGYIALQAGDMVADAQYECIYNEDISASNVIVLNPEKENQTFNSLNVAGKFSLNPAKSYTIASGIITITNSDIIVDTESAAASDDLVTISGGVNEQIIFLAIANDARNVVIKHNSGNIFNPNGIDLLLDLTTDSVTLMYREALSKWVIIGSSTKNNFLATKATTGEIIYPNGIIEKWGIETAVLNTGRTVTFANPFPNACLNVQLTPYGASSPFSASIMAGAGIFTTTNFFIDNTAAAEIRDWQWRAIGY
jgi:hypothetical protein